MTGSSRPDHPSPFTVFFATSENLGLSTTLRNVADILTESRHSVLVVDGRTGGHDGGPVPEPAPGRAAFVHRPDAEALTGIADDPVARRYDHVLVEAPVPDSPGAAAPGALARLADSFVVCFALSAWSIDGAAALAEELSGQHTDRPVRMLALGLKSNVGVRDGLRDARERVRARFGPLARPENGGELTPQQRQSEPVPFLEIPFNPLYQDSRVPAVAQEDAGTVSGLRPYYGQLADWLRTRGPQPLTGVTIVHSGSHAPWAAWLEDRLRGRDISTELRRADTYRGERPGVGSALLFLSPGGDEALLPKIGALSHPNVRIVLVDEALSLSATAHHERIDLRETTEEVALQRLYAGLGLRAAGDEDGGSGIRFPRLPDITNVTSRNGDFVDRGPLLAGLDEQLREAGRSGRHLVLHGPSGWGKSEAARELCHRFGAGYDVVWWVRSWQEERVRRGLARLAGRLGVTEGRLGPSGSDEPAPLAHLSDPVSGPDRWLIVYDGVDHPDQLDGLLPVPHERGHVLITSRQPPHESDPRARTLAVPRMAAHECRALLRERVPEITADQAGQLGAVLDHVPLALHVAACCLAERAATHRREDHHTAEAATRSAVVEVLDHFRTAKTDLLERADTAPPVVVMVEVARTIAQSTPGAAAWLRESPGRDPLGWLLDAASLLTGRGMGLELLRSRRILSELARDDSAVPGQDPHGVRRRHPDELQLPDEHMVSVALWSLARVGLLDVDFDRAQQPLTQHHALRDVIRAGMEPSQLADVEQVLRGLLAEYVPNENQDLPPEWAREVYSLHLWKDERPRVRRSLLRHLNALSQRGESADLARLLDIAAHAEQAWHSAGDEQAPEYLRLLNLIARAHRLRGDYEESRYFSEQALRGHRRLLGLTHPRTLLSADSHAATLRALGRFDDALTQLRPAMADLTLLLGWKHPATVQVEHNLAFTEALTGRYDEALERLLDRFRYRQAVGGEDDPAAWRSADVLAYLHRMVGRDREARDLLRQYLRRGGDTWDAGRLKVEVGLATSERRLADAFPRTQDPRYGFEGAYARDLEALRHYVDHFGADRIETLRCRFSLAADLHALGKHEDAEEQARRVVTALAATFGAAHPYTGLGQVRHGVYLRATGDTVAAEAGGRSAVDILGHKLGRAHPWVAAAENSLAATLAAAGRADDALRHASSALTRLRDLDMSDRPLGRRVWAHHATLSGSDTALAAPPTGFDIDLELPGL